jgi:hypothetical protein
MIQKGKSLNYLPVVNPLGFYEGGKQQTFGFKL